MSTSNDPATAVRAITRELAEYAVRSSFDALPGHVTHEATRAFLNWMGCVCGGSRDPMVAIAADAVRECGSAPRASLIGLRARSDGGSAAFVNCLSSSALAFDDAHLATVTHPTGPVASALFAWSEQHPVSGEEFVNALAAGMEIVCRMSNVLLMPPAKSHLGFMATSLTGPIGAAAALGRLMKLDESRMRSSIGLAATQCGGFRASGGTMAQAFGPAHAARSGFSAAVLASKGFTHSDRSLEAPDGFVDVFSTGADLGRAVQDIGSRFELLSNGYKPYPCGIVIHASIDACMELAAQLPAGVVPERVTLRVHPITLSLCDRRHPQSRIEAQVSVHHWAAVSFVQRAAGVGQLRQECIDDPLVRLMRERISAIADPAMARDEAVAEAVLPNGDRLLAHIAHARGSLERPLTDSELASKFDAQVQTVFPERTCERLRELCVGLSGLQDVGRDIAATWQA